LWKLRGKEGAGMSIPAVQRIAEEYLEEKGKGKEVKDDS